MLGAIIGDIVGSRFEFNNHRSKDFDLFTDDCFVTDDSIMTIAVAKAIMETKNITEPTMVGHDLDIDFYQTLKEMTVKYMQEIGRRYPNCGYGGMFAKWMFSENPKPYNSYGNGAAMRISPAGVLARTEYEAIRLSEAITSVTHNHDEGIKGAEATAVAIYMAGQGYLKSEIREKITDEYYPIDFKIDEIRLTYQFNETCQETVPQAIACFLESKSFEDAIRTAISIGGDSDTIGAITGAIAEAYYGIPEDIRNQALAYLDSDLKSIYDDWESFIGKSKEQFTLLTKYIGKISAGRPIQLPFVHYNNLVLDFEKEFYQFVECNPEYALNSYEEILETRGIKWDEKSMENANYQTLDAQCVLALIMGAIRAERFCDGALLIFFENGSILKWLKRLKDIDFQDSNRKLSEVFFGIGGFRGYETYHLVFVDEKSILLSETFPEELKYHKINSMRETEKLISDWINLHTEYWEFHYPQNLDMLVCDGTQWSLYVRYEGSQGVIYIGDNNYPESWDSLLNIFGIASDEEDEFDDENRVKLKLGEVIFCSVSFNKEGPTYYYQTDDECIEVGDIVIVPIGLDNHEGIGIVEEIEYFSFDKVPFPLNKIKFIIGKAPNK